VLLVIHSPLLGAQTAGVPQALRQRGAASV